MNPDDTPDHFLAWLILGGMLKRKQLIAACVVMLGVWLAQQSHAVGRA